MHRVLYALPRDGTLIYLPAACVSFSYLPFGGGQRKCIGDVFATFEVRNFVALTPWLSDY